MIVRYEAAVTPTISSNPRKSAEEREDEKTSDDLPKGIDQLYCNGRFHVA
jgi:hypothetical protein